MLIVNIIQIINLKRSVSLFIIVILCGNIYSQIPVEKTQKENHCKPLKMCIEIPAKFLTDSNYFNLLRLTKEEVLKYNIDEIRVGGNYYDCIKVADFPLVKIFDRQELINRLRSELQWFKNQGLKITLYMGGEPLFTCNVRSSPEANSFFDLYPEAKFLDNGMFWKFLEERTYLLFRLIPEADALSFHLWETPLLDDLNYFTGLRWQKDSGWYLGSNQYFSQADYLTEMIAAYSRGANKAGKGMSVLSFCHYPHQEKLLIESFTELEKRNTPMTFIHKSQPGDWDPYRGPNNVMLNTHGKSMILFDGVGEYWGGSRIPYCFPEEIQYRLLNALENNKNIESLGMRVFDYFDDGTLFANYNEINFIALTRFAENPQTPVEDIWKEWADMRFGEKAAPKIIAALKRTDDIGKKIYYFKGIWVQQHSQIASLEYLEAQVLHTGRAMITWYPDNILDNGLIKDFMYNPTEETIQVAVNDRKDALNMCIQSIQDVESVKNWLQEHEYRKLIDQLNVQEEFVKVTIFHIEAYLRYKIYKNDRTQENYNKLLPVLAKLEELAKEINVIYKGNERLLSGNRILNYVNEIKNAI
jgi:hypothetical protein